MYRNLVRAYSVMSLMSIFHQSHVKFLMLSCISSRGLLVECNTTSCPATDSKLHVHLEVTFVICVQPLVPDRQFTKNRVLCLSRNCWSGIWSHKFNRGNIYLCVDAKQVTWVVYHWSCIVLSEQASKPQCVSRV